MEGRKRGNEGRILSMKSTSLHLFGLSSQDAGLPTLTVGASFAIFASIVSFLVLKRIRQSQGAVKVAGWELCLTPALASENTNLEVTLRVQFYESERKAFGISYHCVVAPDYG